MYMYVEVSAQGELVLQYQTIDLVTSLKTYLKLGNIGAPATPLPHHAVTYSPSSCSAMLNKSRIIVHTQLQTA